MLWRDGIAESVPEAAAKDKVERIKDKADDPDSYFILSPLSFILSKVAIAPGSDSPQMLPQIRNNLVSIQINPRLCAQSIMPAGNCGFAVFYFAAV